DCGAADHRLLRRHRAGSPGEPTEGERLMDQRIASQSREQGSDGLRFAANVKWLFTDLPFEARIAAAAEHGFSAVEYPDPYGLSVGSLAKMLTQDGVELALINTPPRTASGRTV